MRKTKIICTMGPSTEDQGVLEKLIMSGMNVARFNFSHGTHEEQGRRMQAVRDARKKCGKPVAIMLDTKGPEIRVRDFADGRVFLENGQEFRLTGEDIEGNASGVSITYPDLYKDVVVGTTILIDDGLIEMKVSRIEGKDIVCTVVNGGYVSNHKGVNVPDAHININFLSDTDRDDILFGIENDVDFIAASFVRCAEDVHQIRDLLEEKDGRGSKIIVKIENQEGLDNIDEIIEASDGIMVARGDMGVEIAEEEVPVAQKMIIKKVYEAGKLVITGTQMLESMINNPRPTRAETADVANAVYDGTSAIMLSGETAAGKFPVEALAMMVRIAERTERDIDYKKRFFNGGRLSNPDVTSAICHATCTTAYDLNASGIIVVTKSGSSARMVSRFRPDCNIIGCATSEKVCRQLNLSWGVIPVLLEEKQDIFDLFAYAVREAKKQGLVKTGDTAVITAGVPIGMSGTTNMLKVEVIE